MASDGSEHAANIGYRGERGTAVFSRLPLSSVKEFRFQVRPYHWVEFKNLSLEPGQKTEVQISSTPAGSPGGDEQGRGPSEEVEATAGVTGKQPVPETPEAMPKQQAEAGTHPFRAQMPQGTVELVGVTKYPPTNQSQWWKPDGSAAQLGPFLGQPTQWSTPAEKTRSFLLRFQNVPGNSRDTRCAVEPCTGSWWGSTGVLDAHGQTLSGYKIFSAEVGHPARTATLRVGEGRLAWETVATQNVDGAGTSTFSRDGQPWNVTFVKAESAGEANDSTSVSLKTTEPNDKGSRRLVAVANDGSEHVAEIGYENETGTAVFPRLPLSSVKEFRYQVRLYRGVEFKNVSLEPGQKTEVQVVSPFVTAPSGTGERTEGKAPAKESPW